MPPGGANTLYPLFGSGYRSLFIKLIPFLEIGLAWFLLFLRRSATQWWSMPRRCPPPTVHATSGVTFLAWTGWCVNGEDNDIQWKTHFLCCHIIVLFACNIWEPMRTCFVCNKPFGDVIRPVFSLENKLFSVWTRHKHSFMLFRLLRPLSTTNTDKLDLQECLEHGRTAKVVAYVAFCLSKQPLSLTYPSAASSRRWGPSPPGPIPSSRARTNTSPSTWTRRRTYSGALRSRGKTGATCHVTVSRLRLFFRSLIDPLFPAGSSASRSTTQTCPTWADWRGRGCWAGRGASRSSATSLHRSKNTLRAFKRQL